MYIRLSVPKVTIFGECWFDLHYKNATFVEWQKYQPCPLDEVKWR
jgi:hypothetical protein